MPADQPAPTVDDVIVAPVAARDDRNQSLERQAFLALSAALAREPGRAVQRLVETAMKLTNADSAGVSVEEGQGSERIFRWIATTGEFGRYLDGTMPRDFSPCGTVLERGATLVMRDPVRHFPYIAQLHAPIRAALLTPFGRGGKLLGTVWVLRHKQDKSFSSVDVSVVESLTTFATSILDAVAKRGRSPRAG